MRKLLLLPVLLAGLSFAEDELLVSLTLQEGSVIKISKEEYDKAVSRNLLQLSIEAYQRARTELLNSLDYLKQSCNLGNSSACSLIKEFPRAFKELQSEVFSELSD